MLITYIGVIHRDPGSDYGVSFPDFPGCITAGSTIEEAYKASVEALSGHIDAMMSEGYEIPSPSRLEDVLKDRDFSGGLAFLAVPAKFGGQKSQIAA